MLKSVRGCSHAHHLKTGKNAFKSLKELGLFSLWKLWSSMILPCKCQRGKMPHTKELFNLMDKGFTRNKRGELKPDNLRFGRKPTFKNLGVELRTNLICLSDKPSDRFPHPHVFKLRPENFLKSKWKLVCAQKQVVGVIQKKCLRSRSLQPHKLIKTPDHFLTLKHYESFLSQEILLKGGAINHLQLICTAPVVSS